MNVLSNLTRIGNNTIKQTRHMENCEIVSRQEQDKDALAELQIQYDTLKAEHAKLQEKLHRLEQTTIEIPITPTWFEELKQLPNFLCRLEVCQ